MPNYLSVTEYAKLNGKDVGNVRRLLLAGRIDGQKVGNQWIIPEGTPYPKDKRESSGKYRNWRQRTNLNRHKDLMGHISNMVSSLCSIYGELLSEVILYGSYARGTQTDESDVDIAIVLLDKPSKKATDSMIDCVAFHELECGKVLSVIDINQNMLDEWGDTLPFYKNIKKEGIVLWTAKK